MSFEIRSLYKYALPIIFISISSSAAPQVLPGSADAGRIATEERSILPEEKQDAQFVIPSVTHTAPIPEEAKKINFTLKEVTIEGVTVFTSNEIQEIYAKDLNNKVSLSLVWEIVNEITKRYRDAGYFLSRAYLPEQSIKDGTILIKVVEGYVGKVEIPEEVKKHHVVQHYIDQILQEKPSTIDKVESFLLRLNDLPGYSFRSVISPLEGKEGEVQLTLIPSKDKGRGIISFDNYSSRYVGPNEVSTSYSKSFIPLQQTTISGVSSIPTEKLSYGSLSHAIVIAPDTKLSINVSSTKTYPEYNIDYLGINSTANAFGITLNRQFIRQRQENLSSKFMINSVNSSSDIMGTPLVRDHIRVLRTGFNYDVSDRWNGSNSVDFTLSRGISGLGASNANDIYLSRAGAKPNFKKAELSISRLQDLHQYWSLLASSAGQAASGTLYSTEQIGYGGQSFGRAYDFSEITGDQGINGALELRYDGLKTSENVRVQPYGFYDIGAVYNYASSQAPRQSGASAGLGIRFNTIWNQIGNIGIAWPLTRDIAAPIYGDNTRSPRFMFQISQEF